MNLGVEHSVFKISQDLSVLQQPLPRKTKIVLTTRPPSTHTYECQGYWLWIKDTMLSLYPVWDFWALLCLMEFAFLKFVLRGCRVHWQPIKRTQGWFHRGKSDIVSGRSTWVSFSVSLPWMSVGLATLSNNLCCGNTTLHMLQKKQRLFHLHRSRKPQCLGQQKA